MMTESKFLPKAAFLLGPTSSGKTAVSVALAQHFPIEIISVDSALVYRGMDIGTAKPTLEERAGVVHHLIDIRDPADPYSVAEFVDEASVLIQAISERGRVPLLVGGTMLYAKALLGGLAKLPAANPDIRERISLIAQESGWPAVHMHLQTADPITAARLHPNDSQRLQRALEVCWQTGKPFSYFLQTQSEAKLAAKPESVSASGSGVLKAGGACDEVGGSAAFESLVIGLMPQDRAWLHKRIAARFEGMLKSGFLEEARSLFDRSDLTESLPAIRCVGYRQAWGFFEGRYDYQDFVEKSLAATRQLAKRQLTWLRGWSGLTPVVCDVNICGLELRLKQQLDDFLIQ